MKQRLALLLLLLFFGNYIIIAQVPKGILLERTSGISLRQACEDQFAGTLQVDEANFSGQSNDIDFEEIFLCFGDELQFIHDGNQNLTGDPNDQTPGGIGYAFYTDRPTVSGPDLSTILDDPNLLKDPPPPGGIYIFTDNINGDARFSNTLLIDTDFDGTGDMSLQDFFNNGNPFTIWFAPITFDDLVNSQAEYEGNPSGPCVNVNVEAAFSVTYLNPINASNQSSPGANMGQFRVTGGLPEITGNYTDINIVLSTDNSVRGTVTSGPATHGSEVNFDVPQPGTYDITVTDEKGCTFSFSMEILAFDPVISLAGCAVQAAGEVCLPVVVVDFENIVGMQYALEFDPAVLDFSRIQNPNLDGLSAANFNVSQPGFLNLTWDDPSLAGVTVPDTTVIYEVCFNIIGANNSTSLIEFVDPPNGGQKIEVFDVDLNNVNLTAFPGKVYVGVPPVVELNVDQGAINICGTTMSQSSGSVSFTPRDGLPPYSYQWQSVSTPGIGDMGTVAASGQEETITGLAPGDYQILVNDQGCGVALLNITIPNAGLGVAIDWVPPTCFGESTGTATAIVFNNSAPVNDFTGYSFSWAGSGSTLRTLNNVPADFYEVTVTDPNGCTAEASEQTSQPAPIAINFEKTDESCTTGNDGTITLNPTGGTVAGSSDYSYNWSIAGSSNVQTGLVAGLYAVSVEDDNGCQTTAAIEIFTPTPPTIESFDSVSVSCVNDNSGSLTVNAIPANPGTPITAYDWSGPNGFVGSGQTINGLTSGQYIVTVTAQDGCAAVDTATLFAPSALSLIEGTANNPSCPGADDGSISIQIAGGSMPYFYRWSTGLTGENLSTLPGVGAGNYLVTVVDANSCDSLVVPAVLEDPDSIRVQFTNIEPVSCFDGIPCDGQATALASGGNSPSGIYDFSWESGEMTNGTSSSAVELCQGMQTLVVSDGSCIDSFFIEIPAPEQLGVDIGQTQINDVSCNGGSDGSISVQAIGGTPGYTYLWADGTNGPFIGNLSPGTTTVQITDANGCAFPFSVEIGEPEVLIASIDSANTMDVSCFEFDDAVIAIKWTGGNNPGSETYSWSPNVSTSSTATNLGPGTYSITVTDSKGCSDDVVYNITSPTEVVALIPTPQQPQCFGFQTGVRVLAASGGVGGPYTFSVNNGPGQAIDVSIPVFAGDHVIKVFDAAGCEFDTTLTIVDPPEVKVDLGPDVDVQLGEGITLRPIVGAVNPIDSVVWTPTDEFFSCPDSLSFDCLEPTITPLRRVTYVLEIYDVDGCPGTDEITINVDKNRNVYLPNVFSPDGNGINDEFMPRTGPGVERINFMQIYDRWGELLFEQRDFLPNDRNAAWNGKYRNQFVDPGVFIYLVEVSFIDGQVLLYRGDVAVIR